MARVDHCFLLDLPGNRTGLAFCSSEGFDTERARAEVARVLVEVKREPDFRAPYLGLLNYREMDEEIGSYLHLFEKHDPVWLLIFVGARETR